MNTFKKMVINFIFIIYFVFFNGCAGYHFTSEYNQLPGDIHSLSIPFFKNETYEANIESYFTQALINEFLKRQKFTIQSQNADATLYGVVKDFHTTTLAYSAEDKVLEYRAEITLELTLKNNHTGETIWRNPSFKHNEEYKVFTEDITLTEANKKVAFQKIANELAEQIYEDLVLGF